ncbi:UNVERIFIED_CONTAM: protein SET DOMAIN GROUP 41 [Sesamum angustifolium]|uniref:Protein SET DOMAIN GROUP 41 n=1 Tax=Sesamum angustifolium TaxID=2727405 RepID=A0AAW2LVX3_9LAMI
MEMRAVEDIAIGQDLTPPLPPLAVVLNDSALSSHCSACFSTLPPHPFFPTTRQNPSHVPKSTPTPLYCSPRCSSLDSPLHFSSGEPYLLSLFLQSPPPTWDNSSDLRLSLRLLYVFREHLKECSVLPSFSGSTTSERRLLLGGKKDYPFQQNQNLAGPDDHVENKEEQRENMKSCCHNDIVMERIAGLMTNRERLIFGENRKDQFQGSYEEENPNENRENREVHCESTENVLEKIREGAELMAKVRRMCLDEDGNLEQQEEFVVEEMVLCLVLTNAVEVQDKSGCSAGIAVYGTAFSWINHSCSPNACYRFSLGMENNEQLRLTIVSAAQVLDSGNGNCLMMEGDFQHPFSVQAFITFSLAVVVQEMRQAELWLKHYLLLILIVPSPQINEIEKLKQSFDDAINDYLSLGNPKSCCMKLENLLSHGHLLDELLEPKEAKSPPILKMHPFHHLLLDAYTTLASAYKVQASDLLALTYEAGSQKLEAFNTYKTSAAYSLLLAGAVHHLFMFESALVASVANFWISAGESLLSLARSSLWDSFLNPRLNHIEFSSFLTQKCNWCCLADTPAPNLMQLEEIKRQISNCIANKTSQVWSMLASESSFLRLIQNPIDFSWLASAETSTDLQLHVAEPAVDKGCFPLKAGTCNDQVGMNLILLAIHCLRYGRLLSTICFGLSAEMNYYTTR